MIATDSKPMMRVRTVRILMISGVAIVAVFCLTRLLSPNPESFESARTQLLNQARRATHRLGFSKVSSSLDRKWSESWMRDLYAAADAEQLVKRIDFVDQSADYGGVAILLRQWASSNDVQIVFTSRHPQSLHIFARSSDADKVSNYLNSLAVDQLSPFE